MANTYTLLETITVGAAGASSVTFNSIPQTGYTDLVIKASVRSGSGNPTWLYVTFNGSASTYNNKVLQGDGSAASSADVSAVARLFTGAMASGASTANTFGNAEIYIPNYTSSNQKSASSDGVQENNATSTTMGMWAGLWTGTAAITSIEIKPQNLLTFAQYSTFSLYGVSALGVTPTKAPKATGGEIIQTDGTYWYHAFLSSGTFTPATALSCDVLVVAGGGGGGMQQAGGGGAGGVLAFTSQSVGTSAQTVTVGAGGARSTVNTANGSNGSNSQFASLTASVGGGGGGSRFDSGGSAPGVGATGGSGGGGGYTGAGGSGTSGQGNAGATGNSSGGGGGGAGAVGGNLGGGAGTTSVTNWGALTTALSTTGLGVSGYLAGGGGGGGWTTTGGTGGSGGGGNGGYSGQPTNGTANTGSGGGGGYYDGSSPGNYYGANGGSGLVIIRYLA
jgi:hypothetical protein